MAKKRKMPHSEQTEIPLAKKRRVDPANIRPAELVQKHRLTKKDGNSKQLGKKDKKSHDKKASKTHKKSRNKNQNVDDRTRNTDVQRKKVEGKNIPADVDLGIKEKKSESIDIVTLPKSVEDISANWKSLQKNLSLGQHKRAQHQSNDSRSRQSKRKERTSSAVKDTKEPEPEIWFDGVDEVLLESSRNKTTQEAAPGTTWNDAKNPLVKQHSFSGLTKVVAMDCEMVGVGEDGEDSILARVSIVNSHGQCMYDRLVRPRERVVDYRTQYSGIRPGDLDKAENFKVVQKEVSDIIKDRVLVGHAIRNDLQVLFLDHPHKQIRDTARYRPFRALVQGKTPSLKKLSEQVLGVQVQEGEHNSIQDAQAAMRLYTMNRKTWEKELKMKGKKQVKNKAQNCKKTMPRKSNSALESDEDASDSRVVNESCRIVVHCK